MLRLCGRIGRCDSVSETLVLLEPRGFFMTLRFSLMEGIAGNA